MFLLGNHSLRMHFMVREEMGELQLKHWAGLCFMQRGRCFSKKGPIIEDTNYALQSNILMKHYCFKTSILLEFVNLLSETCNTFILFTQT